MPYGGPIDIVERDTTRLLSALERHRIPAIGFVNENNLLVDGVVDERRVALLKQWIRSGQELGNHTFSHRDLHSTPAHVFQAEIERGDDITGRLLAASKKRPRYFRHPFLHTGRSLETKAQVEKFLAQSGYRVAPVTIDNYDYLFARAHHLASAAERPRIERAYLDYMTAVVSYYEQQSAAIVGREIRQILLLHANGLNAQTLPALATMLEQRGYTFVTLDRALEDPAYQSADQFTGAGGITWLHRWAMTRGMSGAIFRGEPVVPDWIERAAQDR
jgi:peptidoglycan/xylan/chitin deacetylase (PgdA/CDA1 family)